MSLNVQASQTDLEPTVLDRDPCAEPGPSDFDTLAGDDDLGRMKVPHVEPVAAAERYFAVDVLRGFALLGILAMNIVGFGWPEAAYDDPYRGGGFAGLDRGVWFGNHMIFEAKMMTIFSMLFGAGLVLMDQRAEKRGAKIRGVYFRRVLWLLAIGLIHSYLIWWGDILVLYAECGLLLYFFRNLRPWTLIILGLAAMLILVPLVLGFAKTIDYMRVASARYEAQTLAGEKHRGVDHMLHDYWTEDLRDEIAPSTEKKTKDWNKEMAVYRGGYLGIVRHRGPRARQGPNLWFPVRRWVLRDLPDASGYGTDETRGLFRPAVAAVLLVDGRTGLRHRPAADGLRRHRADPAQVLSRLHDPRRHLVQPVRQLGRGLGSRGTAHADRPERRDRLAHPPAGRGGPHGPYELPDPLACLHDALLRLWLWPFRPDQSHRARGDCARDLDLPAHCQPDLAEIYRFGPAEWLWRSLTYWRIQPMRLLEK